MQQSPVPQFRWKWGVVTAIVLAALIVLVGYQIVRSERDLSDIVEDATTVDDTSPSGEEGPQGDVVERDDWETYTSEEFGFRVSHPPEWDVSTYTPETGDSTAGNRSLIVPAINIYDPDTRGDVTAPFDHFAEVVNVSVYPHGIPTEGVLGERVSTGVDFQENTAEAVDYVVNSGAPWAVMAQFQSPPASWESYGYIWARSEIKDRRIECFNDGEKVTGQECDPLLGSTLVRYGHVDDRQWATIEAIVESFEFTEE